jgi:hypothetical protein
VERRDERQLEVVLEGVAGDAREPVVGVEDVGPALARQPVEHTVGEPFDQLGQLLFGHQGLGAGPHVVDAQAGLDLDGLGQAPPPGTGVHVAVDARPGQGRGQLPDVHVHAATVTRSGLGEGRRVEREDGEAAHDG